MTTVSVDKNACVRVQNEWTSNTGNEQARGTLVTLIQTESELQYWLKSFHKSTGGKDCNTIHSMMKNSVGCQEYIHAILAHQYPLCMDLERLIRSIHACIFRDSLLHY